MRLRIDQWLRQCRFLALALVLAAAGALALAPAQAEAAVTVPVAGTVNGKRVESATVTVQRFITQTVNGRQQLAAVGTITGTVRQDNGTLRSFSVGEVVMPVAIPRAECPILNLVLGPLDLNLLGLRIQLSQVVLDITAVPGAGNLLGNLLCAVANLLNPSPGPVNLAAVVDFLNAILGRL